jgi:ABC-type dipeptide/oligopeptide/nickel transport system ATPase subunit
MSLLDSVLSQAIPSINIQENRGQIAIGEKILQIDVSHGGKVNFIRPEQKPRVQPRPTPIRLRPRFFPNLLDRKEEIKVATTTLQSGQVVEFCGESGLGKTSLLCHLIYQLPAAAYPDGVIFLSAQHQFVADLLQSLFDAFYESDIPVKPTEAQIRHALQSKRALIFLDDIDLARTEIERLINVAPNCAFFLATPRRCLWGGGQTVALNGLPPDDALALMERELGYPLAAQERPEALNICATLKGHPLRLLQVAALVREEKRSLAQVARQVQQDPGAEALTWQMLASLSIPERRIVAVLAALDGMSLSLEHLAVLTKLPNPEPVLETLLQRGLIQTDDFRYKLAGTLDQVWPAAWDLTSLKERALTHFSSWAEQHQQTPERLLPDAEVIRHLLGWAIKTGRWSEVLRLVRAVEGAFTLNGRWGAWVEVLRGGLKAAKAVGDRASKAWALHQLGTHALCVGDTSTAGTLLGRALRLRETLGDQVGAAVTRHNLDLFLDEGVDRGPGPGPGCGDAS